MLSYFGSHLQATDFPFVVAFSPFYDSGILFSGIFSSRIVAVVVVTVIRVTLREAATRIIENILDGIFAICGLR